MNWAGLSHSYGRAFLPLGLAACALLCPFAPAHAAQIQVASQRVDVDTRPDLPGLQSEAAAVKDSPTGVATLVSGFSSEELVGLTVRARLQGPGVDEVLSVAANALMAFPRLATAGIYTLTEVELVNTSSGEVVLRRDPSAPTVTFDVIDELLVSQVTSRPLTADEISEKGIIITDENFTAFEFNVGLTIGSEEVEIEVPFVLPGAGGLLPTEPPPFPVFAQSPKPFETVTVPNLTVTGFSALPPPEIKDTFEVPPVTGLIIIPGNIAFLNQFFSVVIVTLNGAPDGSGLVVENARAQIKLPQGPDGALDTGDDPLRLAATDEFPAGIPVTLPLLDAEGSDALNPQRSHEAEFLVEGLREGTHGVNFEIMGDLFVPALGETVPITGDASGVVQVRNPTFSISLAHPDVVREGEPYSLFATVTNTSSTPANFFELGLNTRSLSGAQLAEGAAERFSLETLNPGQAETFEFNLVARNTGEVTGTVFLADDSVNGAFVLNTGVGPNTGIPLSPDTLVLPEVVNFIPDDPDLVFAVVRLLGQAYSLATAPGGTLPPEFERVRTEHVFDRGVKLAQVGLHARFGESRAQGAWDVLFDQLSGDLARLEERFLDPIAGLDPLSDDEDVTDAIALAQSSYDAAVQDVFAFDVLRRAADAGHNLNDVIGLILEGEMADGTVTDLQRQASEWFTSRPMGYMSFAAGTGLELGILDAESRRTGFDSTGTLFRDLPLSAYLPIGASGASVLVADAPESPVYEFQLTVTDDAAGSALSLTLPDINGTAVLSFDVGASVPVGTTGTAVWPLGGDPAAVTFELDYDGDGIVDEILVPDVEQVLDSPPNVLGVFQWGIGDRPRRPAIFDLGDPFGRVAAVLFDEPVLPDSLSEERFLIENNFVADVVLQPDGRLVFIAANAPFGPFIPRDLVVREVSDLLGNVSTEQTIPIVENPDRGPGGVVRGRVLEPDGTPVPYAQIRYIQTVECPECLLEENPEEIVSTILTDENGEYVLEYVLQNAVARDFRLEVIDPSTGNPGRTRTNVRFDGQQMRLDVIIRGFGSIVGRLLDEDGNPVTRDASIEAPLRVIARNLSTGERVESLVDPDGNYSFPATLASGTAPSVPVGNVALQVVRPSDGATALTTTNIPAAGVTVEQDLILVDFNRFGAVEGRVVESDGVTGAAGVEVQIGADVLTSVSVFERTFARSVVASTITDESGRYSFDDVPVGDVEVFAFRRSTYEQAQAQSFLEDGQTRSVDLVFPGSGASVSGTVFDASGLPLANATVVGGPSITTTDASGGFVLNNLPVGQFPVFAQPDFGQGVGRAEVSLTSPGQTEFVTIFIEPLGTIEGTLTNAQGIEVAAQEVQLWTAVPQEGLLARTFTDEFGRYAFRNYPVGEFTVRSVTGDFGDGGLAKTSIRFNGDTRDVDIQFRGLGTVRGRVEQGGAGAIADVIVTRKVWRSVSENGSSLYENYYLDYVAALQDELGSDIEQAFLSNFRTAGPPQQFFILNTERALVRSDVLGPGGEVTGDFVFDGPITGGPFTVTAENAFAGPSEVSGEIPRSSNPADRDVDVGVIVLEATTGSIEGTVFMPDGTTPVGADVLVQVGPLIEVRTDENGFYRATLVPVGGTNLVADTLTPAESATVVADANTDSFEDLNVRLYGQAAVAVPSGATVTADIRLLDVAGLDVTVIDSAGQPVGGAVLTLNTASSLDRELDRTTFVGGIPGFRNQSADGAGRISFFPVIEGRYSLSARDPVSSASGSFSGTIGMDPPNGTEVVAQIQLGAVANDEGEVMEAPGFGDIAGTVFRADGTPLSNPSEVVINTGMVRIVTTSAPDGTFSAELVPEGAFRIDVFEPATARTGDTSGRVTREQTTVADVTLVGLGSVSGTVFVNDGSSPVSAASITLFPSGNFTAPLVTTADVQGSYRLPGVPIGPYTVSAQDFISGLRGSADGEVFADGEELGTDVFLDASGSITGTVYAAGTLFGSDGAPLEADGVTPCSSSCFVASANVTFNGPEERVVQTGPDGRFDSGLFLPLGEYSVVTRVPAGGQGSRDRVTLSFEGDSPDLAVVLGGFGTVEGVVLDSTGTNPVDLAQVTLRSSNGFSRGELATQTDADGRFAFSEVSVGSFVLNASKTVQGVPLGASKTGELNSDGEVVLLEGENAVVLEQTARVRVRVLLSDGGTAAAGSVVTARGANVVVSVVADENGDVEFSALRLGSYQFEFRDSASNGVASRSVTLATNGETRDLGEIVLDETPPEVVLVDPPANSANVDPNTAIELTFSEQIRESTVDTIEVTRGGVPVAGAFAVIPDPLVPERSRVVFTPSAPLPDLTLITVRVPGEERSFDNELVSVGVTDLEGIGLDSDFVSSFATGDTTSPNVVGLSPLDGAVEVDANQVLRVEFDEAIQTALLGGVTLLRDGVPVSGTTSFAFDDRVVIFQPAELLLPNGTYTATLGGPITDLAGNSTADVTWTFRTIDTLPPTVTDLTAPTPRTEGSTAPFTAVTASADVVAVEFFADGTLLGRDESAPFTRTVSLPVGASTIRIGAIPTDAVGNRGALYEEDFSITANEPSTITINTPTDGQVLAGGTENTSQVELRDIEGLLGATFAVDGGVYGSAAREYSGGQSTSDAARWDVPANLPHLTELTVTWSATDVLGVTTSESVSVQVADATDPEVSIVSPSPGATVRSGENLVLVGRATDISGLTSLRFNVSGAFNASEDIPVDDSGETVQLGTSFLVPADVVQNQPARVEIVATDSAGNTGSAFLDFDVVDQVGPSVVAFSPEDLATDIPGVFPVTVDFDEQIDLSSATAGILVSGPAGVVPGVYAADDTRIVFTPDVAFEQRAAYRVTVDETVTDLAGNSVVAAESGFSVTSFDIAEPAAGASLIEGEELAFSAALGTVEGVVEVRFALAGTPVGVGAVDASVPLIVPSVIDDGTTESEGAELSAEADYASATPFVSTLSPVTVLRAEGDADGDAMTNLLERTQGTDPFTDDADQDPDGDGLSNLVESRFPIDPFVADTDGDGLDDGVEDANANGVLDPEETDPRTADTDGDGIDDKAEVDNGLDPRRDDADEDPDGDGVTNAEEIAAGTDPFTSNGEVLNTAGSTEPVLLSGRNEYDEIFIAAGTTVRAEGTQPLELISRGPFVVEGTISVRGADGSDGVRFASQDTPGAEGVAGGGAGGEGSATEGEQRGTDGEGLGGGGGGSTQNLFAAPGAGGGFGSLAAELNGSATRGAAYGSPVPVWSPGEAVVPGTVGGSGGGGGGKILTDNDGGGGGGGAGGGVVYLEAPVVEFRGAGLVTANGGDGGRGAAGSNANLQGGDGGGGSGGYVWIRAAEIVQPSVSALGGTGSTPLGSALRGGEGSVGRIRLDAERIVVGATSYLAGADVGRNAAITSTTPPAVFLGSDDYDGDGVTNSVEFEGTTDLLNPDSDGDGLLDGLELASGLDALDGSDASGDPDGDGVDNSAEARRGTDPFVDDRFDADGDGLVTALELTLGSDPYVFDSDGDGLSDGEEDRNGDGRRGLTETSAIHADSDLDGLNDSADPDSFDQDLDTTGLTELELYGTYVFRSITIAPETTVRGSGRVPLELYAYGDVTVAGTIDASGRPGGAAAVNFSGVGVGGRPGPGGFAGGAGGAPGQAGSGPGAGAGATFLSANPGSGGGGGFGASGFAGTGSPAAAGGPAYGDASLEPLTGGSGGGGGRNGNGSRLYEPEVSQVFLGSGGGGAGGAVLVGAGGTFELTANGGLLANGGPGGPAVAIGIDGDAGGGGGGGSGGAIYVTADRFIQEGALETRGGTGAAGRSNPASTSQSAGGAGRLRVDARTWVSAGPVVTGSIFEGDSADSDGDGISDISELGRGLDPFSRDSDGDGLPDSAEDVNRNGVVDPGETDPRVADSDGDGTPDGAERVFAETFAPVVSPISGNLVDVRMATVGETTLVVWRDVNAAQLQGARVRSDGTVLDPNGLLLTEPGVVRSANEVTAGDDEFLVTWLNRTAPPSNSNINLAGARVGTDGRLLGEPIAISDGFAFDAFRSIAVAFGGGVYTAVYVQPDGVLRGSRLTSSGGLLVPVDLAMEPGTVQSAPRIDYGDGRFLVAATVESGGVYGVQTRWLEPGGTVQPSFTSLVEPRTAEPVLRSDVSWDGTDEFVVYWGQRPSPPDWLFHAATVNEDGSVVTPAVVLASQLGVLEDVFGLGSSSYSLWNRGSDGRVLGVPTAGITFGTDVVLSDRSALSPVGTEIESGGLAGWRYIEDAPTTERSIYGRRVNFDGEPVDAEFPIATQTSVSQSPRIAFNGSGYLAVWQDNRLGSEDVLASRVDLDGTILDSPPLVVAETSASESVPAVASDGDDYLVTYLVGEGTGADVAAALVSADGVVTSAPGVVVADSVQQSAPQVASSGDGYVLVYASNRQIFAQHVTSAGVASAGPRLVTPDGGSETIASDGANYMVIFGSGGNIFGSRVTVNAGVTLSDPVFRVSDAAGGQRVPVVASFGGEYLAVWEDSRLAGDTDTEYELFGARISASGTNLDPSGIQILERFGRQPRIVSTPTGYYLTWRDAEVAIGDALYGKAVNADGSTEAETLILVPPRGQIRRHDVAFGDAPMTVVGDQNPRANSTSNRVLVVPVEP